MARLIGEYAPPTVTGIPAGVTAEAGSEIRLSVQATGYQPMSFQWFFNGARMDGCTNRCLDLAGIASGACGTYSLVVTNPSGALTSAPVTLNVIPPVPRRPVPALNLTGTVGGTLNVQCANALGASADWLTLGAVTLTSPPQFFFDVTTPLPAQRFYRTSLNAAKGPSSALTPPIMVPTITLTGTIGDSLRLDCINQIGPTNAWVNLATVTLTNTTQLYFDVSAIGQPRRLYRIVPPP